MEMPTAFYKKGKLMNNSKAVYAHFAALFTITIWGTTYISTKILLKDFSPVEIMLFRFIIGLIALFIVYPHFFKPKPLKQELLFASAGLCGVTLYFLLQNIALDYTFASNVGIIVSIAPMLTVLLAWKFEKEHLKISFFVGFAAAMAGIVLVVLNGDLVLKLNPLGDILAALAALVWAIYSIIMKKISSYKYNTIQITRRVFIYGLAFIIPVLFIFNANLDLSRFAHIQNLFNIFYLGLGASALCFVSWNWSIKILGAVKTNLYIYLNPVISIVTAAIILHEGITPMAVAGTALTLAGLYISQRK
jgi:drug/metabolite transporter (DMT)-like permease